MSHMLIALCSLAFFCIADDELISGRPLSDDCSGLVDRILLAHEEHYIRVGGVFNGRVVAITEDTITVVKWRNVSRVFRVSPAVASEKIPLKPLLGTGHRLSHVRVGDKVGFDLAHARDGYVITGLGIYRRPGGIIPEAEDGHLPAKSRLHIYHNTEQFIEEVLMPKLVPYLTVRFLHYSVTRP